LSGWFRAHSPIHRGHRAHHIGGGPKQRTSGLHVLLLCQRRRFALLRTRR
jgi:hypothetical protein